MTEIAPGKIVVGDVAEHAAMQAWRTLRPSAASAERIEILKGRKPTARRSAVRLVGVGPGGSAVIAKRYPREKALLERHVYQEILPHAAVSAPQFYGCVEEDGSSCWLFLEDVGAERYCVSDEDHRRLGGRWLGRLHTAGGERASPERLVDLGPASWLEHVRSSQERIRGSLGNAALTGEDREVLVGVLQTLKAVEAQWGWIEQLCAGMPRTLVHGDFVGKNIGVRSQDGGVVLLPFDWGQAGWGPPAVDLAECRPGLGGLGANVDVTAYWEVVRRYWPGVDLAAVQDWARVGTLVRCVMAVWWEAASLASGYVIESVARLGLYRHALDAILDRGSLPEGSEGTA